VTAVKIGANRQIIIPKKAFEALGLAGGDYLDVTVKDKPARHDGFADDTHPIGDQ
jgi:AbrB family looped-hinge helix DNA binding protein